MPTRGQITDSIILDIIAELGTRITGINETTRQAVMAEIMEGVREGEGGAAIGDRIEDLDSRLFSEYRGELIARTETNRALNVAQIESFKQYGVEQVRAIDGDEWDEECRERDGQVFSVADAMGIEDHPNGTLDWVPLLGPVTTAPVEDPPSEGTPWVAGANDLANSTQRFTDAGGTVGLESGSFRHASELRAEFNGMVRVMPEGWSQEPGPHATNSVFNSIGTQVQYIIARDANGDLAGAMDFKGPTMLYPESMHINLVGSTGIAPGAGSAMVRELIGMADEQNLGIRLDPLVDAKAFWERVGLSPANNNVDGGWGATAKQVHEMWAILSGL